MIPCHRVEEPLSHDLHVFKSRLESLCYCGGSVLDCLTWPLVFTVLKKPDWIMRINLVNL